MLEGLERARALGFLGPGPVDLHMHHAAGFARVIEWARRSSPSPSSGSDVQEALRLVDLGSGGGVPGLELAVLLGPAHVTLVDSNHRRCDHLRRVVGEASLEARVEVLEARAEEAGRDVAHRHSYEIVTARSFGPPAVTAECAAPFLAVGGVLVISEPPDDQGGERWSEDGLALLGMGGSCRRHDEFTYQVIRQEHLCPDRFPRRVGVPAKRPLF